MNKNYITKYSFRIHHCYLKESVKPSYQSFIRYLVLDYTPNKCSSNIFPQREGGSIREKPLNKNVTSMPVNTKTN